MAGKAALPSNSKKQIQETLQERPVNILLKSIKSNQNK